VAILPNQFGFSRLGIRRVMLLWNGSTVLTANNMRPSTEKLKVLLSKECAVQILLNESK
jgi:hypothetical protein